jgi:endoglucanase
VTIIPAYLRNPNCVALLFALVIGSVAPTDAQASVFGNGKGLPLASAVNIRPATGPEGTASYEDKPDRFSPAILAKVKRGGFDSVRLMVTVEPLLTTDPAGLARAVKWISGQVDQALAAKLGVVVDLHPWVASASPMSQDAIIPDARKREMLTLAQVAIARVLQPKAGGSVAFELLNEPPCHPEKPPHNWASAQRDMVTRIRKVAPTLPLILKGCRDRIDSLVALDPRSYARDANVYWSIHYYQPSSFAEQTQKKLTSVPFPPNAALANSVTAISRMVPAATAFSNPRALVELRQYLRDGRGRATIAADFDQVVRWARRNRISPRRIWLGEWGSLIEVGPSGEAVRKDNLIYLATVRQEAERRGFAWSVFGIGKNSINFDRNVDFVRQDALRALGISARR